MGRTQSWQLGLVSLGILAVASGLGCQPNNPSSNGGSGGGGASGGTTASGGTGGNVGGTGGTVGGTGGTVGGTGGVGDPCTGDAIDATVYQITDQAKPDAIGLGIKVSVAGAVATSRKFLVSKSSTTNSCLWGVFVSAPLDSAGNAITEAQEYSGILALSYGDKATEQPAGSGNFFCPKLSDAAVIGDVIPNDVKPGDVLNVVGKTDQFLLSQCSPDGSQVGQFQISQSCKMEKTGATVSPPAPHLIDAADYSALGSNTDEAFHAKWGGALLEVKNVTPKTLTVDCAAPATECLVNRFGQMFFEEGFGTGDKLYYRGYSNNFCHDGPMFDAGVTFNSVVGNHYLDFCTWNLQPSDKCADYDPSSNDCAGAVTCTFDM